MAEMRLSLEQIRHLDGGASGAIIDAAIADAVRDIDDRGEDGKPRTVEIRLNFIKRPNGQVEVEVEAAAKVPRRRTASTCCNLKSNPTGTSPILLFQQYSPADPDQRTIDELE